MKDLNINKFGCSQGRLILPYDGQLQCFPKNNWKEEFFIASRCKLDFIELLSERIHNKNNPIWSEDGIKLIKKEIKANNLEIYSSCLDYVIENSIFSNNIQSKATIKYVIDFLRQVSKLDVKMVILPLLEKSDPSLFELNHVEEILLLILEECKNLDLILVIESLLNAQSLLSILDKINNPLLGCVYDTGNRYELDDPVSEISYLSKYIKHIHLKDKRNSLNVVIGTGCVDFLSIFKKLEEISYKGSFCFETNRGINPTLTMLHNLEFIKYIMHEV